MSTITMTATSRPLQPELERLFRDHSQMLYCTAYSMLGNTANAEDVLQTLFLRLLRHELPPDLARNTKGYLYRAAVNLSVNVIRSRKITRLDPDAAAERFGQINEGMRGQSPHLNS